MVNLLRAIEIAKSAHSGQLSPYGEDYIHHPIRVMNMGRNENEKIVGILHDVVEDTPWSFEELVAEGFSAEIIEALKRVTKYSDDEPYDDFIERSIGNDLAICVKVHDITDNINPLRLPCIGDREIARIKKYHKAYLRLKPFYDKIHVKTYNLSNIQQNHPNAYMPWSTQDDERLEVLFCEKKSIKELSEIFARQKSAISSRIRKLELKEKYSL